MKKLLLFLTLFSLTLHAEIFEIKHFKDILEHAKSKDAWVLLDIDDTLLVPNQMLGSDEWFGYQMKKHEQAGLSKDESLQKVINEWQSIRYITKMRLVEKETSQIIQTLQKKGHPVMALTTQEYALATRTQELLKEQQIDLSQSAPSKSAHLFHKTERSILYRDGILFTSGGSKGESLLEFIEQIGYSPKCIIFVDDKASHLKDVEKAANIKGIPFIGLRYAHSDLHKAAFKPEIAEVQYRHSTFHHVLSDEEARALLK